MGGHHFGELAKVRGIVTYKISPFEQRAFAKVISHGLPNTFRRMTGSLFRVLPPFVLCYLVYDATEKVHSSLVRKNPADFENES